MNPSKLKSILILLFVAIDLFFLYKLTDLVEQKNDFRDEHITESVEILKTKGILIEKDTVIKQKKLPETLKLDWSISSVEQLAKKLMQNSYGSFNIPNGHSFTGDRESLSFFYDYSFEYNYTSYGINTQEVEEMLAGSTKGEAARSLEKLFEKLFAEGRSSDIGVAVDRYTEINGVTYVEAHQTVNEVQTDGASFHAALDGDRIIFISGRFYPCNSSKKYVADYLDSINILFELEASEEKIEKMEMLYLPVIENNECIYLVPTYKFTYSNGNVSFYDATSGVKRK